MPAKVLFDAVFASARPFGRRGGSGLKVLACVALSVAAHAAVLSARVTAPSSTLIPVSTETAVTRGGNKGAPSSLTRVRMIQQPVVTSVADANSQLHVKEPSRTLIAPRPSPVNTGATVLVEATQYAEWQTESTWKAAELGAPQSVNDLVASEVELMAANFKDVPGHFDGSNYVPRGRLSVPPSPRTDIVLEVPEGEFAKERYVGILTLFIDEQGHVQHVAADDSTLPPAFEQVAREIFMAAQFDPGQMGGNAVKSRQRVEATFDNTLTSSSRE